VPDQWGRSCCTCHDKLPLSFTAPLVEPIKDLGSQHDPDWWIKKLVERENIALLPPARALRKEDAEVAAWRERRTARIEAQRALRAAEPEPEPRRSWWRRRRSS